MKKEFELIITIISIDNEDIIKTSTTLEEMNEKDITESMNEN